MKFDFDAALFDLDGTLIDSMRYWRLTTMEYLIAHSLPVRDEDFSQMYTTSSRAMLKKLSARDGWIIPDEQAMISELEGYMNRRYCHDVRAREGVPALLAGLKARGMRLCVATATPREYAKNALDRLGLAQYFDFITDGYENGLTKSDPAYFPPVAARLGTTPDRCVMFEDALYAMRSARAAGCGVVAFEDDSQRPDREAIKKTADWYFVSPKDFNL